MEEFHENEMNNVDEKCFYQFSSWNRIVGEISVKFVWKSFTEVLMKNMIGVHLQYQEENGLTCVPAG